MESQKNEDMMGRAIVKKDIYLYYDHVLICLYLLKFEQCFRLTANKVFHLTAAVGGLRR